jgi:TPR repeat protein
MDKKAAELGDPLALYHVGASYKEGIGVQQDDKKAFEWYLKSAEQGFDVAQYTAGVCYYEGEGVEKNLFSGFAWVKKAAEQGHRKAANQGFPQAIADLSRLKPK